MVTNDATLVRLKHKIMEETAKLAWEGKLDEEHKEKLIYEIIPGPMATYRCCVYKERELVKQRIRLSFPLHSVPMGFLSLRILYR